MTVVYLDSVFLFNALLDYLLFLSTARLAGILCAAGATSSAECWAGCMPRRCSSPAGAFSRKRW